MTMPLPMNGEPQLLAWDSQWLGVPVARFAPPQPDCPDEVLAAVAWSRAAGIRLLYLVLDPQDVAAATAARTVGAWLADARTTYETSGLAPVSARKLPAHVLVAPVREATPELEALARQSGEYSRFRRDERIGARAFAELYRCWLHRSLREGSVWTAALAGQSATGLLALGEHSAHTSIELLAVAPAARRQGLGHCLVQLARQEAWQRGHSTIRVVTQGHNQAAKRLYEHGGFEVRHTEHVYHLWL